LLLLKFVFVTTSASDEGTQLITQICRVTCPTTAGLGQANPVKRFADAVDVGTQSHKYGQQLASKHKASEAAVMVGAAVGMVLDAGELPAAPLEPLPDVGVDGSVALGVFPEAVLTGDGKISEVPPVGPGTDVGGASLDCKGTSGTAVVQIFPTREIEQLHVVVTGIKVHAFPVEQL
jgi:hypothetical protein